MSLDYLKKYLPYVNLENLQKINEQKLNWKSEKNTTAYLPIEENINKLSVGKVVEVKRFAHVQQDTPQDELVEKIAKDLIPWRKGPFKVNELEIDSEWRSDLKWERIKDQVGSLENKVVLDIGCNNGYYMFHMLNDNPELVLGIDPVVHNKVQFDFINKIAGSDKLKFELFGVEDIPNFKSLFDVIFSMGILYHHRHPLEQLIDMRNALRSEGTLILETIGIPGEGSTCLFPEDRYAKMRNVWFLPTLDCLKNWLNRTGFINLEVLSVAPTTIDEQRNTPWCPAPFQSLEQFLDPNDPSKTIEGYPAPVRFSIKAQKKVSPQVGF
jgi:tRNA (mo5U34)-methyltransferase